MQAAELHPLTGNPYTLKCLKLGHLKSIIFHLSQMESKWFLSVPIFKHNIIRLQSAICPDFGIPKIINFPLRTNGKIIFLGFGIFKHITVASYSIIYTPYESYIKTKPLLAFANS